jgi:hypothetical protein
MNAQRTIAVGAACRDQNLCGTPTFDRTIAQSKPRALVSVGRGKPLLQRAIDEGLAA